MADRIPLEKPSLSHTSQEPEGLAWAQIGTNLENGGKPSPEKSAGAAAAEKEQEDDAGSEVDLRVDEDAEPEEESEAVAEPTGEADEGEEAGAKEGENSDKKGGLEGEKKRAADDELEHKRKTNSLDPRFVRARVFVGHLNTNKCTREDVEKLFEPHGKIVGVSLQNGYGFVQFEDEEGARRAIKEVHGQQFAGMRIVVDKPVALKRLLGEDPDAPAPWPEDRHRMHHSRRPRPPPDGDYFRYHDMMERFARLEELERFYYDRYTLPSLPPPMPSRDPYYERGYGRHFPPPDRYADRYRFSEFERGERYDRYGSSAYDRPRDELYERRDMDRWEREPVYGRRDRFEKDASFELRDAAPFERHDAVPFERHDAAPFERREGREAFDRYGPPSRRM